MVKLGRTSYIITLFLMNIQCTTEIDFPVHSTKTKFFSWIYTNNDTVPCIWIVSCYMHLMSLDPTSADKFACNIYGMASLHT